MQSTSVNRFEGTDGGLCPVSDWNPVHDFTCHWMRDVICSTAPNFRRSTALYVRTMHPSKLVQQPKHNERRPQQQQQQSSRTRSCSSCSRIELRLLMQVYCMSMGGPRRKETGIVYVFMPHFLYAILLLELILLITVEYSTDPVQLPACLHHSAALHAASTSSQKRNCTMG